MDADQARNYEEIDKGRYGLWIHTYTGQKFYAFDPKPQDVNIDDIAQGLSLTCRFSGQCNQFYSVAQHSVYVSHLVPKELALEGLLHDAPEAYITDIPRPIKHMLDGYGGVFGIMESGIYAAIADKFGILDVVPEPVHQIDHHIVANEATVLFDPVPEWVKWYTPLPNLVIDEVWDWQTAKHEFMSRFKELYNGTQ